jgi:pyridoxamine 5'-phosphate oxidase
MRIVGQWLKDAWERRQQPNPNAMVLATTSADARPSARVVLCKGLVEEPGYLVFYTNYESKKGEDLAVSPCAAAVMHWDYLHRQVRVTGPVTRSPPAESDAYFASRPWPSRIAAWASKQSRPIASRADLVAAVAAAADRLWAESVELWQEGKSRIHDRFSFTRKLVPGAPQGFTPGPWSVARLQP